jgi:hypothetical protein
MKVDCGVVHFKSTFKMFIKEKNGWKNNTVRLLNSEEYEKVLLCHSDEIMIENSETGEIIMRRLTDVTEIGSILGSHILVFSWADDQDGEDTNEQK